MTSVVDCLRLAGWLPTAGSTGVYLSIRARAPGISRDAVDRAALDGTEIVEVPGPHARPPVLVPRDEMAVALRLHAASFDKHVQAYYARSGHSGAVLKAIGAQACRALDEGPLSTSGIRARVTHPDAGELLTGALIGLALGGVIRRYPSEGRLDSAKYAYELQHPDDRPDLDGEGDNAAVVQTVTRLFLRRYGPASVDEMADRTFLTKGALRRALAAIDAERITIDGWTDDAWLLARDVKAWKAFAPGDTDVVFLPYRDPYVAIRRPQAVLARRDASTVLDTELRAAPIRDVTVLHHHVIVAGGELVGVWEYDPGRTRVLTRVWTADKPLRARVDAAAHDTERFIQQQIGDAPLSAVDPPAKRAKRMAFCRRPR